MCVGGGGGGGGYLHSLNRWGCSSGGDMVVVVETVRHFSPCIGILTLTVHPSLPKSVSLPKCFLSSLLRFRLFTHSVSVIVSQSKKFWLD